MRKPMRKIGFAALALTPLAAFGCTAILGDFTVSANAIGDGGGGTDGTATTDGSGDETTLTDANHLDAFDAQSTVWTTCSIGMPKTIEESFGPLTDTGFTGVQVFPAGGDEIRVVARRKFSEGVVLYRFNPNANGSNGPLPSPIPQVDLANEGRYLDARRLPQSNSLALLFMERNFSTNIEQATMKVLQLRDSGEAVITDYVSKQFSLGNGTSTASGNITGALGIYGVPNEYFWALGEVYGHSSSANYDLLVGHRVPSQSSLPTPFVAHSTTRSRVTSVRFMARAGSTFFIVNDKGPEPGSPEGTSYFAVPENPTASVQALSLAAPGGKPFVALGLASTDTGDGLKIAAAEVDFSSLNFGTVRAGVIPQSMLTGAFDGTKIPVAFALTSLTEVPAAGEARFFGDDLLWLGAPPDNVSTQGLNFIWFNAKTRVVRAREAGMKKLYPARSIKDSAFLLRNQTPVIADIDVVFVEEDQAQGRSALQYARMTCVR